MPELKYRTLATSKEDSLVNWNIHNTGSLLVGEYFNASYYRECLKMAKSMKPLHRPFLTAIHTQKKSKTVDLESVIQNAEDISRWAEDAESEDFHLINTQVFIGLWAAQEAGIENILGAIVQSFKPAAELALSKFKPGKYQIADWPWSEYTCLEIVKKLDHKAKESTTNGGERIAERIQTMFRWIDLEMEFIQEIANTYNEASMVRNVIVHQYGRPNTQNIKNFPHLAHWEGKVLHISSKRLQEYYKAIVELHLSMANAFWNGKYKHGEPNK